MRRTFVHSDRGTRDRRSNEARVAVGGPRSTATRSRWCRAAATIAATAGLALVAVPPAGAGFDWPKDVEDAKKSFDGERFGRDGTFPTATIDKLEAHFSINEAAAKAKLTAMRKNVKKAIAAIKAQDAALGKCLEDMLNCERLCIDFKSTKANAAVLPRDDESCRKDPVNIGVEKIPCTEVPLHSEQLYQAFSSLMHEAKHSVQDYLSELDDSTITNRVKKRRQTSCNEIEAEQLENTVIDALLPALAAIIADPATKPTPGMAAQKFVDSIFTLPEGERADAARKLRTTINNIRAGNVAHINCQNVYKAAFTTFLASPMGAADLKAMNDAIRATRWFTRFGTTFGAFGLAADPVYFGGGDGGTVTQRSDETVSTVETGFERATDMLLIGDGSRAIVAGAESPGSGGLVLLEDLDGDRFYDRTSPVLSSSMLEGGIALSALPGTTDVLAFPSESSLVHLIRDTDGDGVPETLDPSPVVAPSTILESVVSILPSADGSILYGTYNEDGEYTRPQYGQTVVIADADGDGFFESIEPRSTFDDAVFTPNVLEDPMDADTEAAVFAASGAAVEIVLIETDGTPIEVIGSGAVDERGEGTIPFGEPLAACDLLIVRDTTNGIESLGVLVGPCDCDGDIDRDGKVGTRDLLLLLEAWGPCDGLCEADLDGDGDVGTEDLLMLLTNYKQPPCDGI